MSSFGSLLHLIVFLETRTDDTVVFRESRSDDTVVFRESRTDDTRITSEPLIMNEGL